MDLPKILACLPTDRELVLEMWEKTGLPIEECPMPTDLYKLANCAYCQRSVWVGPRQQDMAAKMPHLQTWCYFCAGAVFDLGDIQHLGGGAQVEGVRRW